VIDAILQILTPTFIVSCLIAVLLFICRNWVLEKLKNAVKHDYDMKLKEFENTLSMKTQIEMAMLNNHLSKELEIAKTRIGLYSEKQFNLYNELWVNLTDLKYSMLQLWSQASGDRLIEFSRKLEETTISLEKSALIVEEHDYMELIDILNKFAKYEIGKRMVIDYRNEQHVVDHMLVNRMIEENMATKDRLLLHLREMSSRLRNQISGCSAGQGAPGTA
jgi:hypothetical protein